MGSETPAARSPGLLRALWALAVYVIAQICVGTVLVVCYMIGHGPSAPAMSQVPVWHSAAFTLGFLLAGTVGLHYAHQHWRAFWHRGDAGGIGFVRTSGRRLLLGIVLGLTAAHVPEMLRSWLLPHMSIQQDVMQSIRQMPGPWLWVAVPIITMLVPVVEETLFRGVLLSTLSRRLPVAWAAAIVTFLFVAAHAPESAHHPLLLMTMLLPSAAVMVWLRIRMRSIYPAIAAHMAFNMLAMIEVVMAMRGSAN